jgi:hypothetical protein
MLACLVRAVGLCAAQAWTRCQQTSRCRRYTAVTLAAQDFHRGGGVCSAWCWGVPGCVRLPRQTAALGIAYLLVSQLSPAKPLSSRNLRRRGQQGGLHMTLFRQLSGLGDSGSARAANSAPGSARGARRRRVLVSWRIFGRNRALRAALLRRMGECKGVAARQSWASGTERALGRVKAGGDQCCVRQQPRLATPLRAQRL